MGPTHHSTIVAMNLLADVRRRQGKSDEAAKLLAEALDLCDTEGRAEIQCRADKEYRLGKLYLDVGDYERTADHLERSFEHYKSLGWYHPSAPTVGSELAYELVRLGRFDEAEKARREVLEIQRDHLGENHPGTLKAMNDLGVFYYRRGRHQEAEPLYLKAIETSGRVLDGDDPVLANFMYNLGELYSVQGRWDEARPLVVGALEIRRRVLGDDHPDTARSKEHAAILKAVDGRHDEAEAMLLEALEALGREEGDRSGDTARLSYNLACLEASRDQPERAMDWLSRSVDAGWADADEMIRDAWLESLHGPEFDALVEHVRRNAAGREADSPQ
jgi:tetratricopeptide (TPR) repeat protein